MSEAGRPSCTGEAALSAASALETGRYSEYKGARPARLTLSTHDEDRETPMSKLKTKSSAKKRFSATGRGKLRRRAAYHRHNLTKREKKVKRNQRGAQTLSAPDAAIVRQFLPYL